MRRSNRSIEVFDISLMAVVTKAMGAFLVIMLLLMPYYKSGPVGEKTAAELAKELNQAQQELKKAIDNMKKSDIDPRDLERLRQLLEETQRRLQMAQMLLDRLKRENDQLNSQVSRLESELQESKQKLAKEEQKNKLLENKLAKLSSPQLNVHLSNSDCHDVVMDVALWNRTRNQIRFVNDTPPINYTFNYIYSGYGYMSRNVLSREVITAFRASIVPNPQVVILIVRDKNLQKINGENGYLLRKTSKACNVTITRESFYPESSDYYPWGTIDMKIAPGTYAQALWEAKLVKDKISLSEPTAEDKAWVQEQIAKAKKAPEVKPPPKESKPISKQDALAAIEKLPVPRAVGECIQLIGRAGTILSQARVRTARTDTLQNVQHACVNSHFAEARKAVQALVREAITGNKNIEDNKRQPSKTEPKKLTKQEALALIDRSPVPTDPRQCMFTAVRSMRMLVELQAVNSQSEKTMREIRKDCAEGRFADAFKKTKDEVHRALK